MSSASGDTQYGDCEDQHVRHRRRPPPDGNSDGGRQKRQRNAKINGGVEHPPERARRSFPQCGAPPTADRRIEGAPALWITLAWSRACVGRLGVKRYGAASVCGPRDLGRVGVRPHEQRSRTAAAERVVEHQS